MIVNTINHIIKNNGKELDGIVIMEEGSKVAPTIYVNSYYKDYVNKGENNMDRMKTFLLYALGILGFMFLSYVLEDGLIENMYVKMKGEVVSSSYNISIEGPK